MSLDDLQEKYVNMSDEYTDKINELNEKYEELNSRIDNLSENIQELSNYIDDTDKLSIYKNNNESEIIFLVIFIFAIIIAYFIGKNRNR